MKKTGTTLSLLMMVLALSGWVGFAHAAFFGDVKTGLQNVTVGAYEYSLYVPKDYAPNRNWPLIVALPDEGGSGADYIQSWVEAATKRGFLVFCPTYPGTREGPHASASWLLRYKRDIQKQYEIDANRILVTGSGFGGHFAMYLGLRYPEEFSAVASIGDAVKGRLEKYFTFSFAETNRLPVLILKAPGGESTDAKGPSPELETIRSKGYDVKTVEVGTASLLNVSNTSPYIFDWFEKVSVDRKGGLGKPSFGFREKVFEWIDQLLKNR